MIEITVGTESGTLSVREVGRDEILSDPRWEPARRSWERRYPGWTVLGGYATPTAIACALVNWVEGGPPVVVDYVASDAAELHGEDPVEWVRDLCGRDVSYWLSDGVAPIGAKSALRDWMVAELARLRDGFPPCGSFRFRHEGGTGEERLAAELDALVSLEGIGGSCTLHYEYDVGGDCGASVPRTTGEAREALKRVRKDAHGGKFFVEDGVQIWQIDRLPLPVELPSKTATGLREAGCECGYVVWEASGMGEVAYVAATQRFLRRRGEVVEQGSSGKGAMARALRGRVIPYLEASGFTGVFPHFRRARGDGVDLLSFVLSQESLMVDGGGWGLFVGTSRASRWPPRTYHVPLEDRYGLGRGGFGFPRDKGTTSGAVYERIADEVLECVRVEGSALWEYAPWTRHPRHRLAWSPCREVSEEALEFWRDAEAMSVEWFWRYFDELPVGQEAEALRGRLLVADDRALLGFHRRLIEMVDEGWRVPTLYAQIRRVATQLGGQGAFARAIYGLVASGRTVVERVFAEPKALRGVLASLPAFWFDNEPFGHVASEIYAERTGEPPPPVPVRPA